MKTATTLLKTALQLIIEFGLTKGCFARNKRRKALNDPCDKSASSYCAEGALHRAFADLQMDYHPSSADKQTECNAFIHLRDAIRETGHRGRISEWNDLPDTSREKVISVFNRAIVFAQSADNPS